MRNKISEINTILLLLLFSLIGCRKSELQKSENEKIISPTSGTRTQFTLDSIYLYARQIYLWNDALPKNYIDFNPRQRYGHIMPELIAFKQELFDISQYKINPISGLTYEFPSYDGTPKYSFVKYGRTIGANVADASLFIKQMSYKSSIFASGDKMIAYVSLTSFPALRNSKLALDSIFGDLAKRNPRYLIVDLRSNSGGYVETAEYVANLILPSTLNGKIMYVEQFNSIMQAGNATILKQQPYLDVEGKPISYNGRNATMADIDYSEAGNTYKIDKKGRLETIEEVYFIVSGKTASASEMLISCLKPYVKVKLVGEKTFGKPIGFFGINIDQYTVFLSSFLIKNAQGWANYFTGMEPDIFIEGSDAPELGSLDELCLRAAILDITAMKGMKSQLLKIKLVIPATIKGTKNSFIYTGMVENRLHLHH